MMHAGGNLHLGKDVDSDTNARGNMVNALLSTPISDILGCQAPVSQLTAVVGLSAEMVIPAPSLPLKEAILLYVESVYVSPSAHLVSRN